MNDNANPEPTPGTENQPPLIDAVATRSGCAAADVEAFLATYGIPTEAMAARPRQLTVQRLRIVGTKAGTDEPGPFDKVFRFRPGFNALVAGNLTGKSSILEIITWCLRGKPRGLQDNVRTWLKEVECDFTVNGEALGVHLGLDGGQVVRAEVVGASTPADLVAAERAVNTPITSLVDVHSDAEVASKMAALMLDRLGLDPIMNFREETAGGGTIATHGWPAYYGALHMPPSGEKVLIGDVFMAGLAGRLLQVFLDVPWAAALTRVRAARDQLTAKAKESEVRDQAAADLRAEERRSVESELTKARDKLAKLPEAASPLYVAELAASVDRAARRLAAFADRFRDAQSTHRALLTARQRDGKALADLAEDALARRLFHGLTPESCPRCETEISAERRVYEREGHNCAVCTTLLDLESGPAGDDVDLDADGREAAERLEASRRAERAAAEAVDEAERDVQRARDVLDQTQAEFDAVGQIDREQCFLAEVEVARLEGALSALPEIPAVELVEPFTDRQILSAAVAELDERSKAVVQSLFPDLNEEITRLAQAFGMDVLENVEINRAARLQVTKSGVTSSFSKQSPGERLRLRIAVVVALLRMGMKHGVGTHPGLLLIDSPAAEEVEDIDAQALFEELQAVANELPALQVLVATANPSLVAGPVEGSNIIRPPGPDRPLW